MAYTWSGCYYFAVVVHKYLSVPCQPVLFLQCFTKFSRGACFMRAKSLNAACPQYKHATCPEAYIDPFLCLDISPLRFVSPQSFMLCLQVFKKKLHNHMSWVLSFAWEVFGPKPQALKAKRATLPSSDIAPNSTSLICQDAFNGAID